MTTHKYSYSQIACYQSCPLKYFLRYDSSLVPLQERGQHDLDYGKAIDAALNSYYRDGTVEAAQEAFAASYNPSNYPAELPYWSPGKTYQNGLAAIAAYTDRWNEDDQYWQVVSVQSVSIQPEIAEELDRSIRLDLVVRDRRDGLIYGVDHKTTGKYLDKVYWSQFSPHSQIRQYVDHIQKKYGECGGFYINALSFKHRTRAYTPRTGPDKGIQLPAGDWHDFKRMCFTPNIEAIQAERDNWDAWTGRIERDRESGNFGYNTSECVRGPITCEYLTMCDAGYTWPRDRELIESYYRQRCIRTINGERCQLAPDHEDEHDATRPEQREFEIETDEVDDAEV